MRARVFLARSLLAICLGGALGTACSRTRSVAKPEATLASSPEAAAAFAGLRARWEERHLDRRALEAFIKRYPDDGITPLAKVYLAFLLMDRGDLTRADDVLASIAELPSGSTRDLATVARARSLRVHGAPQSALDSLRPLVGKIVDELDREFFLEELALSAIGAHDDYEALAYLDAWLRGVSEDDRDRVRAKIAQILDTLQRPVLEQTYRTMRSSGTASGYSLDTQKLVAARLSRIAVETNDAALARWLLDVSGVSAAQTGGDAGLELGELAASRRGLSVVTGRTVGLLLPTRTRELRDEAADVVRGLSWALDLPRSAGRTEAVRLVTREDGVDDASTRAAMEELTGEGAVIIVGGFDRASADRAVTWSEASGVPVLLLAAPSPAKMPKSTAVVLGERTEREVTMLAEALVRHGVKTAAFVADTADDESAALVAEGSFGGLTLLPSVRCDVPLAEAGKPRFPVDSWLASGAHGFLVSGPGSCARDVLRDVSRLFERQPPGRAARATALTLEAGIPFGDAPRNVTVLSASAGIVPVLASKPSEARDEDVRQFMDRFGARPSYWTALGRDGGALARAAMAPLPVDSTSDARMVVQRRAIVTAGLTGARVRLWTTDDQGVGKNRVVPRALRVVSWDREK